MAFEKNRSTTFLMRIPDWDALVTDAAKWQSEFREGKTFHLLLLTNLPRL